MLAKYVSFAKGGTSKETDDVASVKSIGIAKKYTLSANGITRPAAVALLQRKVLNAVL